MASEFSRIVVPEDLTIDATCVDEGQFCSLLEADHGIFIHVRYGNACVTPEDVDAFAAELQQINALPGGSNLRLIADVRQVRGNNHADFEAKIFPIVMGFSKSFSRFVAVTASVAGALQMQRVGRNAGYKFRATNSMREAVELALRDDDELSAAHIRPSFLRS